MEALIKNKRIFTIGLFLLNLVAINLFGTKGSDYLTITYPQIMQAIKDNTDALITQRQMVNLVGKILDAFVAQKEIADADATVAKKQLEDLFVKNYDKASFAQKSSYRAQQPFQFLYNKFTDKNASYLEKLVYAGVVAAGIGLTIFGLYHASRYVSLKDDKDLSNTLFKDLSPDQVLLVNSTIHVPSKEILQKKIEKNRDFFLNRATAELVDIKEKVLSLANQETTPLRLFKEVGSIIEQAVNQYNSDVGYDSADKGQVRDLSWDVMYTVFFGDDQSDTIKALLKLYNNKIDVGGL